MLILHDLIEKERQKAYFNKRFKTPDGLIHTGYGNTYCFTVCGLCETKGIGADETSDEVTCLICLAR